jgi:hypothetical protein
MDAKSSALLPPGAKIICLVDDNPSMPLPILPTGSYVVGKR